MDRRILACLFFLLALAPRLATADARATAAALLAGSPDRSAATPEATRGVDLLEEQARRLTANTGARIFRQSFLVTVPVIDVCRAQPASADDTTSLPLLPLMPMGGQPPSLGVTGPRELPVIYGHAGTLEDLRGKSVANALVALDIDAPEAIGWQRCASLGAAGVVFLGNSHSPTADFLNKSTTIPLGLPRFYCDDASAVAWFMGVDDHPDRRVSVELRTHWQERSAENLICFLPGRGTGNWINQWVILQARHDASSQIMGQAPGATSAFNAGILLDLARQISAAPAHCGVVLVWTGADEWNFRGTREFLDLIHRGTGRAGQAVVFLEGRRVAAIQQVKAANEIVREAQQVADSGWPANGAGMTHAAPVIAEELLRQSSHVEAALEQARLASTAAAAGEVARLGDEKQTLLAAINLVNGNAASAAAPAHASITQAAAAAVEKWQADIHRLEAQRDALQNWPDIRAALPGGTATSAGQPDPLLFLSVAFTGGTNPAAPLKFGLLSRSFYCQGLDVTGPMSGFSIAFRRYGQNASNRFEPRSLENASALQSLLPLRLGFSSDAAIARGLPAAAFTTLLDPNTFFGTPNDTLDQLDVPQLEAQAQALTRFLLGPPAIPGLLSDPLFYARVPLQLLASDQTITLFEHAIGENLPTLKAAQALVGGESEITTDALGSHPLGEPLAGTRRDEWLLTHADGTAVFQSVLRAQDAEVRLQAYEFDEAGLPLKSLAANQWETRGMKASFYPQSATPYSAMLFECRRLDAYGLFDPRYLDTLAQLQILDARRLDDAQFSAIYARRGIAALFLPPADDMRWQLLASRGNASNRMILLNGSAEHPAGIGFDSTNLADVGPLRWRAAQDFFTLDQKRKTDLETFGISNEIIRNLHADSTRERAAAVAAEDRNDHPAFAAASDALLAMQSQEYQTLIDTSNGIIHGVIFLLLGVIPFSYFLERLLFGSPSVYKQIGWFTLIFVCMTFGLWFHPAFRISNAPLMILLAFFILILSGIVVTILWGKFEEEIKRLRGTAGETQHVQSFRRGAVLGAAFRLGLSNMRRRAMRTTLTLITLVLLTFTLLCFTSVRESVQVSPHAVGYFTGRPAPPAGILLHQRAWQELPPETLQFARELTLPENSGAPAAASGTQSATQPALSVAPVVAPRYWYASQHAEQIWLLPVQSGAQTYFVSGLLGLAPEEAEFQPDNLITRNLAADSCWLPEKARDALHLSTGDTVSILGFPLKIAGFFSPETFGQLRQLTGDPLSPIDAAGEKSASSGGAAGDPSIRPESNYHFLPAISIAIVPARITQRLDASLTSIMFRPAEIGPAEKIDNQKSGAAPAIENLASALAQRSAFTLYASTGTRVLSINAAESSRPQDLSTVIVPIIIAGIIVLNTMLGAVSERTREIHVYTSVGLSPSHVGMLFLAEAAALGTLGIVFGYIFGQALATVLSWTHLLPGVDLNYSSMSAIFTMGMVLAIVMLSSLWPAHAASRLAVPSLQRDWKLPRPVGDLLLVDLPFTVNESAAKGTLAFLAEFLITTSAAGTGRFTADQIAAAATAGTQGFTRTLTAKIWLSPFDLGVIQAMQLSIHPTDQPHVYDVHVQLTREAGNPATWRRLNRPFLTEIRRQFLLWRALDPERIAHYVEASATLFNT